VSEPVQDELPLEYFSDEELAAILKLWADEFGT
jgi:hypothetical protein